VLRRLFLRAAATDQAAYEARQNLPRLAPLA
jgi:hypothetical protein